ncbi:MAG: chlorite dismutase family protein [Actinomycetota bacterium]|nr:chlorite dismutase family protein [Actinomycetota bacterium]
MRIDNGLGVLHLFARPRPTLDREAVLAAIKDAVESDAQVVTAALLGHKADLAVMALHHDWAVLRQLQTRLRNAGLDIVSSYVSLTEVSEYAKGMPEHMTRSRLYPELPPEGKPVFCFYPMSKARDAHANWYATPYGARDEMMREHGRSGRTFAGQVTQLVTGSTGLDSHEWGVTLFGVSPEVIKEVVYTMRFDKASALYGEFDDFYVGYLGEPAAIVDAVA